MMNKEEFDKINQLEDSHWWYVGTREICFSILSQFLPKRDLKILDVGCGTGGNLKELEKLGNVEGVDYDPYAVELCNKKGFKCKVGDLKDLKLEKNTYDLITLFDVLSQMDYEYVPKIFGDLKDALKKDGLLLFREPSLKQISGKHDIAVNIHFRLEKDEAIELLKKAGFKILYASYINFLLSLLIFIKRKIGYALDKTPKSDVYEHNKFINALLLGVLRVEKFLLKFLKAPFGISLVVVAQKLSGGDGGNRTPVLKD